MDDRRKNIKHKIPVRAIAVLLAVAVGLGTCAGPAPLQKYNCNGIDMAAGGCGDLLQKVKHSAITFVTGLAPVRGAEQDAAANAASAGMAGELQVNMTERPIIIDRLLSIGESENPDALITRLDEFISTIENSGILSSEEGFKDTLRQLQTAFDDKYAKVTKAGSPRQDYTRAAESILKAYEFVTENTLPGNEATHIFLGGDGVYWYVADRLLRGAGGDKTKHFYLNRWMLYEQAELNIRRGRGDMLGHLATYYRIMAGMIDASIIASGGDESVFRTQLAEKFRGRMAADTGFKKRVMAIRDGFLKVAGPDAAHIVIYDIGTYGVQPLLLRYGIDFSMPEKDVKVLLHATEGSQAYGNFRFGWVDLRKIDLGFVKDNHFVDFDTSNVAEPCFVPAYFGEQLNAARCLLQLAYNILYAKRMYPAFAEASAGRPYLLQAAPTAVTASTDAPAGANLSGEASGVVADRDSLKQYFVRAEAGFVNDPNGAVLALAPEQVEAWFESGSSNELEEQCSNLAKIAKTEPERINKNIVSALGYILKDKRLKRWCWKPVINALVVIAERCSLGIAQDVLQTLESILVADELRPWAYIVTSQAVAVVFQSRHEDMNPQQKRRIVAAALKRLKQSDNWLVYISMLNLLNAMGVDTEDFACRPDTYFPNGTDKIQKELAVLINRINENGGLIVRVKVAECSFTRRTSMFGSDIDGLTVYYKNGATLTDIEFAKNEFAKGLLDIGIASSGRVAWLNEEVPAVIGAVTIYEQGEMRYPEQAVLGGMSTEKAMNRQKLFNVWATLSKAERDVLRRIHGLAVIGSYSTIDLAFPLFLAGEEKVDVLKDLHAYGLVLFGEKESVVTGIWSDRIDVKYLVIGSPAAAAAWPKRPGREETGQLLRGL